MENRFGKGDFSSWFLRLLNKIISINSYWVYGCDGDDDIMMIVVVIKNWHLTKRRRTRKTKACYFNFPHQSTTDKSIFYQFTLSLLRIMITKKNVSWWKFNFPLCLSVGSPLRGSTTKVFGKDLINRCLLQTSMDQINIYYVCFWHLSIWSWSL